MPIYDNDGTTNYEIGKLYDNDGTADHQIGKVYDNNGTANSLIYEAELMIYQNGVYDSSTGGFVKYEAKNSGGFSITSTYLRIFADRYDTVGGNTWVRTINPIDLTNFSTLTFTAYRNSTHSSVTTTVGFDTSTSVAWANPTYNVSVGYNTTGVNYTLDVSNLSGNYYLHFAMMAGYAADDYYLYVNNILLK